MKGRRKRPTVYRERLAWLEEAQRFAALVLAAARRRRRGPEAS